MTKPTLATRAKVLDDPKRQKLVIDGLRRGLSNADAGALVGVSREAIRLYRKVSPEFDAACTQSVAAFLDGHLQNINSASADDARFSQWVLERRFPSKFSTRLEMRRPDDDEDDREADDAGDLSDEELVALANGEKR